MSHTAPLLDTGAMSPFVPETKLQFAWDSVSLGTAMSCWRKYQLLIIEGWQPRGAGRTSAIALNFGILFHKGLEIYHKNRAAGDDHDPAIKCMIRAMTSQPGYADLPLADDIEEMATQHDPDEDDGITLRNSKVRTRYHLIRALVWYLEHYRNDPISTHILHNGKAAVEVSFRVELPIEPAYIGGRETPYVLSGHLDRVGRFNNSLYVVDYKTTKSLSSQFFSAYSLSHQISGYTFAGRVALEEPVAGVVIDGIALQVGGCKFSRAPSPRSQDQLDEFFSNANYLITQAESLALRLIDDPSFQYPMNTQSCYFCEFKQVCQQPPSFRRRYLAMNFEPTAPWNPLENR